MRQIYYKLHKIENQTASASVATFADMANVDGYVNGIIDKCINAPVERRYNLSNIRHTTKDQVVKLIMQEDVDNNAMLMAQHLSAVEKKSNDDHVNLKGKIPVGILLIALVEMDDNNEFRLLVIKCDYDEFITEGSGQQNSGLSIKNQIYKTCQYCVKIQDGVIIWNDICASDSTRRSAAYWHDSFLELDEMISDKQNTKTAFEQIKKNILKSLKHTSKSDYLLLLNSTIAYMRREGTFSLDEYKDDIIGAHNPIDPNLDIPTLKSKVEKLRDTKKFDATFNKVTDVITNNANVTIKLTDEIELKIKQNINGMENILLPIIKEGRKGVLIISEEGYEYAKGFKRP